MMKIGINTYNKELSDKITQLGRNNLNELLGSFNSKDIDKPCLHDQCPECKGNGKKENGESCFHYISCGCKKCTPNY